MKKDSFTQVVKNEICNIEFDENQAKALLAGFFRTNATIDEESQSILLQTENLKIANLISKCIKSLYKITPSFKCQKKMKLDKCDVYYIRFIDEDFEILNDIQLLKDDKKIFPKENVLENSCLRAYITGCFLASGSVSAPDSDNYHLQMIVNGEDDGHYLIKLLNRFHNERHMDFKMIKRRNKYVVYLKKADQISIFLVVINANDSMIEFENVRVEKDFINSENRYQICFNANYQKTLEKANEQINDINIIVNTIGMNALDERQQMVAKTRLENNDVPLSQISELIKEEYGITISKSSVNRIFSSIHELALMYGGNKHE